MQKTSPSILVIDDDKDHLALVARYVEDAGYSYALAEDGLAAIEMIKKIEFKVIITDMVMPTLDGMQIIKFAKQNTPLTSLIVMTGYNKNYSYTDVIKAGASDFITKPFPRDELIAKLSRIFREEALLFNLRQEIERHKKTSAALLIAKNTAEDSNNIKSSFINTISHEFLTPMNGIMGFSEILGGTDLDSRQQEFLQMIKTSSDRLMHLINQLLDFSKLESKQQGKHQQTFLLSQILEKLLTKCQEKLNNNKLTILHSIDEAVPDKVSGDPAILQKILLNLVENSINFTQRGEIRIEIDLNEKFPDNVVFLHFSVKDTGCGIPEDKQETIFKSFTQVENYLTRSHDGVGLGLAVCKKQVELLGGKIWLESKPNKGSTFHFTAKFKSVL